VYAHLGRNRAELRVICAGWIVRSGDLIRKGDLRSCAMFASITGAETLEGSPERDRTKERRGPRGRQVSPVRRRSIKHMWLSRTTSSQPPLLLGRRLGINAPESIGQRSDLLPSSLQVSR